MDVTIHKNRSPHCPDGWWVEYTDSNGDAVSEGPYWTRKAAERAAERIDPVPAGAMPVATCSRGAWTPFGY